MRAWRTVLVLVVVVASLAVGATALAAQRGDRSPGGGPGESASSGSATSLGVDPRKGTCPTASPERLPPAALAGATHAALAEAPKLYQMNTTGRYVESAYRGELAPVAKFWVNACAERPQYGKRLQRRSVQVNMIFPKYSQSASLSQHWVFVARFDGEYRVWGIYR